MWNWVAFGCGTVVGFFLGIWALGIWRMIQENRAERRMEEDEISWRG